MKIVKPMTLALLHRPYRQFGENRLVVATLGFFRLGEAGPDHGRRLLTENLQWPEVQKALPEGFPLDEVMPKAHPEVLAAATAHAPGGAPVEAMEVAIEVGDADNGFHKRLQVSGDREWLYGLLPLYQRTRPHPFTAMPLTWERAFGGPDHPGNPVGQGHVGHRFSAFVGANQGSLPNVEYPGAPLSHAKAADPAGFGPLDPRWAPRAGRLGTYDQKWLKNDHPGLPRDLQWSAFNRAPEDQWLAAPLDGGEPYRVEGLHPTRPLIEGEVPAIRPRAFIRFEGEALDQCAEIELTQDTLWLFPDLELGVVIHRGQTPVSDSDALDVAGLMVAYEHADDAPRPLAHYQRVQALRLDPETAAAHALDEGQLAPALSAAEEARRAAEQQAAEAQHLAKEQALLDEQDADFWADAPEEMRALKPADYAPPKAKLPPLGVIPKQAIARGELDLSALLAKADALAEAAAAEGDARMKEAEEKLKELPEPPPQPAPDAAEALAEAKHDAERRAAGADPQVEQLQETMALADEHAEGADAKQLEAAAEAIGQLPAQRRAARRAAPLVTVEPPAPEHAEAVAHHLGEWARAKLAAGGSLAGADLAGADLRGFDLRGLDLHEVMLERADLRGVRFDGADLRGAVLTAALVEGARFDGADLSEANLSLCDGAGVRFTGARLDGAQAVEAKLDGADFSHASLERWSARGARLAGARFEGAAIDRAELFQADAGASIWRGARGAMAVFAEARLDDADFGEAQLVRCAFPALRGERSRWDHAVLERCFFGPGSRLQGAQLTATRATYGNWREADLRGADLTGGSFAHCDFGNADLGAARLREAVLYRSILMGATLDGCDAEGADLFHALARKCSFRGARLDRANLTRAEVSEAVFTDAGLREVRPKSLRSAA